jgi:hypothetical protein
MGLPMLPHHSTADMPPPAAIGRFPGVLCFQIATRDLELEFEERKGPFCEVCDSNE